MEQSFALHQHLDERRPQHAVIVGAGYIGMEMSEALSARGISTTLLQRGPHIHPSVDSGFSERLSAQLAHHGVRVITQAEVSEISRDETGLMVHGTLQPGNRNPSEEAQLQLRADLVLIATGVQPVTDLAETAGVPLGMAGAIQVTPAMETGVPNIYAAGDCVHTHHRLLPEPTYLPLGTTAHKQGRVAGENAVGGSRFFAGSVGTQVVKVCDLAVTVCTDVACALKELQEAEAPVVVLLAHGSVSHSLERMLAAVPELPPHAYLILSTQPKEAPSYLNPHTRAVVPVLPMPFNLELFIDEVAAAEGRLRAISDLVSNQE
jgi:pyruvate/2-oxoglutarate dehydrogenase complex dihydrolipoamide dehydrogenase (E3) component